MADTYRVLVTASRDWGDRAAIEHQLRITAAEAARDGKRPVLVHGQCDPRHPDTRRPIRWDLAKKMSWEVQGRYLGGDWLAEWAALILNFTPTPWQIERHPADWSRHKKAAGFIRNAEMVALGADVCLCFASECRDPNCRRRPAERHDSHGASHCAERAADAGIPVRRFPRELVR